MRKKEVGLILLVTLVVLILVSQTSNATITQGNPFFNLSSTSFGPGQTIDGFVNFSLINQPNNIYIIGKLYGPRGINISKTMTISDFLTKSNEQFTCNPTNCLTTYSDVPGSESTEKIANLNPGNESLYGIKIYGNNVKIVSLNFLITGSSSDEASCSDSPLKLDLLNDNSIDWEYAARDIEPLNNCSDFINTCYFNSNTQNFYLDNTPRCEKIKIGKTGKVDLSASINIISPEEGIELSLYDPLTQREYSCSPPDIDGWTECSISATETPQFFINESRYVYVCIRATRGSYSIKSEADHPCGFFGNLGEWNGNFTFDYPLYIKYYGFPSMNEPEGIQFDNTAYAGQGSLENYIQSYINSRYQGNCVSGCVIPLKFISNGNQQITISQLLLSYNVTGGLTSQDHFFDITPHHAIINMSQTTVPLTTFNFTTNTAGAYSFSISLGGISKSAQFTIAQVPIVQGIWPQLVMPNIPTTFHANIRELSNPIQQYIWSWGDNYQETTFTPDANHTYTQIGTYTLTLKIIDTAGLQGSNSFTITSNLSKETLNESINKIFSRINNITIQYNSLEQWYADMIGLNLTSATTNLNSLRQQLQIPTTPLQTIKAQLDDIDRNTPASIIDSYTFLESSICPNLENIDPNYIKQLASSRYNEDQKEEIQNAIDLWQQKNLELKIGGSVKGLVYQDRQEDKATILNIKLIPNNTLNNIYLIFNLPSNINFNSVRIKENPDVEVTNLDDAIGFAFSTIDAEQTVTLALPGKHELSEINFYASPALEKLQINETGLITNVKKPFPIKTVLLILIVIVVIIALLFIWKDKGKGKQGSFKNSSDLYNITNFINISQAGGLPKEAINQQLENSGWTKKQIDFAWKNLKESPGNQDFKDLLEK